MAIAVLTDDSLFVCFFFNFSTLLDQNSTSEREQPDKHMC